MMSRFPSWLLSAMTGSPAIGPTLIGEPGAILKLGDFAAFGSRSRTARTVVETVARRIIEIMLSRFIRRLSAKGFVHLIRLDGERIQFLPFFVIYVTAGLSVISTLFSTIRRYAMIPQTSITPHNPSASANDPVMWAMNPVNSGAKIAPMLPPVF